MSMTFTKLFSSITESSLWSEDHGTRLVWITMLAKADRCGRVWASVPGLARTANVSLQECQRGLKILLSPDEHSRTPDHQGIRIEKIDGGWRLLNYRKYRDIRDQENAREKNRLRVKAYRERQKAAVMKNVMKVTLCHPNAEAEAEVISRTHYIKNGTPYQNQHEESEPL